MTNTPLQASDPTAPTPEHHQSPQASKETNVLGIISLIVAAIGFLFACIPGAFILGWVLLPIGFILALVSLFMRGKGKGLGIAALIVAVVGTVVGVVVFFATLGAAVDEAFSGGEVTIETPVEEDGTSEGASPDTQGTRSNPYPIGTAITQGDWTVTINSVNLDATDLVLAENPFNEAPSDGNVYALVNITAKYNGTDPDGAMPTVILDYVTGEGNTIKSWDAMIVAPEPFDSVGTLYEGASTTGNVEFEIPAAGDGTLAVTPHVFGDKVFVAVRGE